MAIMISIFALIIGLFFNKQLIGARKSIAYVLTYAIIPIVIMFNVININYYKLPIILWVMLLMLSLCLVGSLFSKNKIKIICFCYLNIGWLGIPITNLFFDNDAVSFIIYAYIGSSLFGNILTAFLLKPVEQGNFLNLFKKIIFSPPLLTILLSIPLYPHKEIINTHLHIIYQFCKYAMSFLGLFILGSWLSAVRINKQAFYLASLKVISRSLLIIIFSIPLILFAEKTGNRMILNNIPIIILISLLPPAANIVVLETSYLDTGQSAKIISTETLASLVFLITYIFLCAYLSILP